MTKVVMVVHTAPGTSLITRRDDDKPPVALPHTHTHTHTRTHPLGIILRVPPCGNGGRGGQQSAETARPTTFAASLSPPWTRTLLPSCRRQAMCPVRAAGPSPITQGAHHSHSLSFLPPPLAPPAQRSTCTCVTPRGSRGVEVGERRGSGVEVGVG
jgi:hypothetical protein